MDPSENPDHGHSEFNAELPGGAKNTESHVQSADLGAANKVLPGEQEDPRLC